MSATTCNEMIALWDNDEIIRSIEMGGLGPGYEQMIQVVMVEIVRFLIDNQVIQGPDPAALIWWQCDNNFDDIDAKVDTHLMALNRQCDWGLSGAQVEAAKSIAYKFFAQGYEQAYSTVPEDRRLMVSTAWPKLPRDCLPKFST